MRDSRSRLTRTHHNEGTAPYARRFELATNGFAAFSSRRSGGFWLGSYPGSGERLACELRAFVCISLALCRRTGLSACSGVGRQQTAAIAAGPRRTASLSKRNQVGKTRWAFPLHELQQL